MFQLPLQWEECTVCTLAKLVPAGKDPHTGALPCCLPRPPAPNRSNPTRTTSDEKSEEDPHFIFEMGESGCGDIRIMSPNPDSFEQKPKSLKTLPAGSVHGQSCTQPEQSNKDCDLTAFTFVFWGLLGFVFGAKLRWPTAAVAFSACSSLTSARGYSAKKNIYIYIYIYIYVKL